MALDPKAQRARLRCNVAQVDAIFADCLAEAEAALTPAGIDAWLDGAGRVCRLGRGQELVLIYLEQMPGVVLLSDEALLGDVADSAEHLSRHASGPAINPFLSTLPAVARRLGDAVPLRHWLRLVRHMAEAAPGGLVPLLGRVAGLLEQVSIGGLAAWIEFGIRAYRSQPHLYPAFFGLATADARAALQRQRHGTLLADVERRLAFDLRALWGLDLPLKPVEAASGRRAVPFIDSQGLHLPDLLDDAAGVTALDHYRAAVAHMAAHRLWSKPFLADNFSVFQHLAVETFEDARVEALAMRRFPGLKRLWTALHPTPRAGACPEGWSSIRHKLAMLSRALLDPAHPYSDPTLLAYVERFHERMAADPYDRRIATDLGVAYLKDSYEHGFRQAKVWFDDTIVDYRDDNRWLWLFLEDAKNEDQFHSDHGAPDRRKRDDEDAALPPRHYPEWDREAGAYRPDWATVYEAWQPPGEPGRIDALLARHALLAKQLKRLVDRLKPQQRKRVRHQAEGDELDLEGLLRARIDFLSGATPDERVFQRHVHDGRDLAVLLLLDLSESINATPEGGATPILEVSLEAVSLLGWAIEALGDDFAIAGFNSNTRHEVRYIHFKGFGEPWGEAAKARLAAMQAGYSTRMGAALRHAGRQLEDRREERRLLLVLTDGEPADIDSPDPEHLKWEAHAAIGELKAKGITTFCITLDPNADTYAADIFGRTGYAVVDRVQRLPERMTRLFMALTG